MKLLYICITFTCEHGHGDVFRRGDAAVIGPVPPQVGRRVDEAGAVEVEGVLAGPQAQHRQQRLGPQQVGDQDG